MYSVPTRLCRLKFSIKKLYPANYFREGPSPGLRALLQLVRVRVYYDYNITRYIAYT